MKNFDHDLIMEEQRTLAEVPDANAHLIAAAPEMLEALETTESYLSDCAVHLDGDEPESGCGQILIILRSAIAKARGEAS